MIDQPTTLALGALVRFNHERNGGPVHRVVGVAPDGMVDLHDMGGWFSPHLFAIADDIGDIPPTVPGELVEIIGTDIVIRVPIDALPVAASLAWAPRSLRELTVTDVAIFAKELVTQLRREKENGDTLVTDMLDAAVVRAVEDGAEGFDLGESPL